MLSIKEFAINPLSPNTSSPHCSSYIPYGTTGENLFYHHNSSSLVITSFILMTCLFDQTVLLLGEIAFGSLLGLKGLRCKIHQYTKKLIFNTTGTCISRLMGFRNTGVTCKWGFIQDSWIEIEEDLSSAYTVIQQARSLR